MGLQILLIMQGVKKRNSGEERMVSERIFIHLHLGILWLVNHSWSLGPLNSLPAQKLMSHGLLKITQEKRGPIYLLPDRMLSCYFGLVFKWLQTARSPPIPVPMS